MIKKNMVIGKFITVEGGEGVGKSKFIEELSQKLVALGADLITTREPGGTPMAEAIRAIFNDPFFNEELAIETELLLVSAARAQHVKNIIVPNLKKGIWVLCDRFTDSTRVYQGKLGAFPKEMMESIIQVSTFNLSPDLTFLLDCDVTVSLQRLAGRKTACDSSQKKGESKNSHHPKGRSDVEVTRYDRKNIEFHERLRQAYLELSREFPKRIFALDATREPDLVVSDALAIIKDKWKEEGFAKR